MKADGGHAVLAGDAVTGAASTLNDLLAAVAVAAHGVGVACAAGHAVLAEANHAYFRVKRLCVFNRPAYLCRFECEHYLLLSFLLNNYPNNVRIIGSYPNLVKTIIDDAKEKNRRT